MRKSIRGFSIVELIVVIATIAILATITVVAYNGIQNRAYDSSVLADLRNIAQKMEIAQANSSSSFFPIGNPAMAAAIPDLHVDRGAYAITPDVVYNLLFCWSNTSSPTDYALLATSKSGKRFYIGNGSPTAEYTGGVTWADSNLAAICGTISAGWGASGAGYASSDTTTGPWRSWAAS